MCEPVLGKKIWCGVVVQWSFLFGREQAFMLTHVEATLDFVA